MNTTKHIVLEQCQCEIHALQAAGTIGHAESFRFSRPSGSVIGFGHRSPASASVSVIGIGLRSRSTESVSDTGIGLGQRSSVPAIRRRLTGAVGRMTVDRERSLVFEVDQ